MRHPEDCNPDPEPINLQDAVVVGAGAVGAVLGIHWAGDTASVLSMETFYKTVGLIAYAGTPAAVVDYVWTNKHRIVPDFGPHEKT